MGTQKTAMTWTGAWQNQYGSVLDITSEADGRIEGSFRSAVDSSTKGEQNPVFGVHHNDLISFAVTAKPHIVSWTGLLRNGRMETIWHLVASEKLAADVEGGPTKKRTLGVWEAFTTGADTFERKS